MSKTLLDRELKVYEQESCKADHDVAMLCRDVEEAIALGIFLFDRISRCDEGCRTLVLEGKKEYRAEEEQEIYECFRRWSGPCGRILNAIEKLEKAGYEVEHAETFRRYCKEVRGVLTPDDKFFTADIIAPLKDKAIDAYRNGETVEIGELSD